MKCSLCRVAIAFVAMMPLWSYAILETSAARTVKLDMVDTTGLHSEEPMRFPAFSIYLELGGKFLPSLNLDYRMNEHLAINFGTGFWWDEGSPPQMLYAPSLSAYFLGGKKHRLEAGGGAGMFIGQESGMMNILVFSNIGYRYQKRKSLFFRASVNPWVAIPVSQESRWWFTPWVGISLGYCF